MIYNDSTLVIFKDGTKFLAKEFIKPRRSTQEYPYIIKQGDTLFSIATEVYGDTRRWYRIAEYNSEIITDPVTLEPGTEILLPL